MISPLNEPLIQIEIYILLESLFFGIGDGRLRLTIIAVAHLSLQRMPPPLLACCCSWQCFLLQATRSGARETSLDSLLMHSSCAGAISRLLPYMGLWERFQEAPMTGSDKFQKLPRVLFSFVLCVFSVLFITFSFHFWFYVFLCRFSCFIFIFIFCFLIRLYFLQYTLYFFRIHLEHFLIHVKYISNT